MSKPTETSLAAGFRQLGAVLEFLDNNGFQMNEHYLLNIGRGFSIFILQECVEILRRKNQIEFIFLQYNENFLFNPKVTKTDGKQGLEIFFPRS